jgi:hypothetical protein
VFLVPEVVSGLGLINPVVILRKLIKLVQAGIKILYLIFFVSERGIF